MDTQAIFGLQFVMSLVVLGLIAKWILAPWLAKMPQHQALLWLTLPHAFRYIGMVFLVPGVLAQPLVTVTILAPFRNFTVYKIKQAIRPNDKNGQSDSTDEPCKCENRIGGTHE